MRAGVDWAPRAADQEADELATAFVPHSNRITDSNWIHARWCRICYQTRWITGALQRALTGMPARSEGSQSVLSK